MPTLLFPLRHVPDDEANDIFQLLTEHHIDIYETTAGNWGISTPAIWLSNEAQYPQAKQLIYHYQQQRVTQQRASYQQLKNSGHANSFIKNLWHQPLQTLFYIGAMVAVFYASVKLVLDFGY